MWQYNKFMQYPLNITKKDLKMAKNLLSQYGGAQGELGAALRYLNQRITMPDDMGRALLNDIGTEELAHVEMICTMLYQLTKGASLKELKEAGMDELKKEGLDGWFTEHGKDIFPSNNEAISFTTDYISSVGDPIANIVEDMAAEQKARAVYEHLILLTDNQEVIQPLLFLRQREVVHYERFKELLEHYQKMGY